MNFGIRIQYIAHLSNFGPPSRDFSIFPSDTGTLSLISRLARPMLTIETNAHTFCIFKQGRLTFFHWSAD